MSYTQLGIAASSLEAAKSDALTKVTSNSFRNLTDIMVSKGFASRSRLFSDVKDRAIQSANYLMSKGWSDIAASAAVGNFIQESALSPLLNNRIGALGIAQWHKERRTAMLASGKGLSPLTREIDYVVAEGSGGWTADKMTDKKKARGRSDYSGLSGPEARRTFMSTKDLSLAVNLWLWHWERPGIDEYETDKRLKYARYVYGLLHGQNPAPLVTPDPVGWLRQSARDYVFVLTDPELGVGYPKPGMSCWSPEALDFTSRSVDEKVEWTPVAGAILKATMISVKPLSKILDLTAALDPVIRPIITLRQSQSPAYSLRPGAAGVAQACRLVHDVMQAYYTCVINPMKQQGVDPSLNGSASSRDIGFCLAVLVRCLWMAGVPDDVIISILSPLADPKQVKNKTSIIDCLNPVIAQSTGGMKRPIIIPPYAPVTAHGKAVGTEGLIPRLMAEFIDTLELAYLIKGTTKFVTRDESYLAEVSRPVDAPFAGGISPTYHNVVGINTTRLGQIWLAFKTISRNG